MSNVALLSACHDPIGKNIALYRSVKKSLNGIYSGIFMTVSDETNIDLVNELRDGGVKIRVIPKKGAANARREVLKSGLDEDFKHYHYCDFDRLLSWIDKYPDELIRTVNIISKYQFLILGRTERAFYTHPAEWIETEKITNKIFSLEFGQEVDITAGSSGFSRESALLINKYSSAKMTDAEWPMIIHRIAKLQVEYQPTEGLEYDKGINGSNVSLKESEEWFSRLKLCYIISESAIKTGRET